MKGQKKEPKREETGESKSGYHGKIKKQERARVAVTERLKERVAVMERLKCESKSGCHGNIK